MESLRFGFLKMSPKPPQNPTEAWFQRLYASNVSSMGSLLSEELREKGAGRGKAEWAHLLWVFCRSSERFCSRGLFLPVLVLVSLTCWHLLGASLSHWLTPPTLPALKLKDVPPLQEPAVRASAGMRRRLCTDAPPTPPPPQLFLLFIFSLE